MLIIRYNVLGMIKTPREDYYSPKLGFRLQGKAERTKIQAMTVKVSLFFKTFFKGMNSDRSRFKGFAPDANCNESGKIFGSLYFD